MKSDEILEKVDEILKEEGSFNSETKSNSEILEEFILPSLEGSKDVLSSIYSFQVRERKGFIGKLKSMFQNKIVNTSINVIEKQSMKQQKFNELTFKAIGYLIEENKRLREEIKRK